MSVYLLFTIVILYDMCADASKYLQYTWNTLRTQQESYVNVTNYICSNTNTILIIQITFKR